MDQNKEKQTKCTEDLKKAWDEIEGSEDSGLDELEEETADFDKREPTGLAKPKMLQAFDAIDDLRAAIPGSMAGCLLMAVDPEIRQQEGADETLGNILGEFKALFPRELYGINIHQDASCTVFVAYAPEPVEPDDE